LPAAQAALQEDDALAYAGEISEQAPFLVVSEDLGSDRHFDDQILSTRAGPVRARSPAPRGARKCCV
jgi:hypothetical protein